MDKRAKRNRKLRRYRGKWMKSKQGQRALVTTTGNDGKVVQKRVKKKFYFNTYDANGKSLGLFWSITPRISKDKLREYKEKHGVKHPAALPVKRK